MIRFEHTIDVKRDPAAVFALLDDLPRTPTWLSRCTGLQKLDPGPNAVGHKLRYAYKDGGRRGEMDGEIAARVPGEHLRCHYWDKMMDVNIDFRVARGAGGGSRVTHVIEITPKTFMGRLFSPLIRRGVPRQTIGAMESLRAQLEREGTASAA